MKIRWLPAVIAALSFASIDTASAAQFNQVIVFGDGDVDSGFLKQFSDPGSNATYNSLWPSAVAHGAGAPFNPSPTKAQVMAAQLGLTANPANVAGGTNYAVGGAKNKTVNTSATGGFLRAVPTVTQIQNYLSANGGAANPQALFVIVSGNNDVNYANGDTGTTPPTDPTAYVTQAAADLVTGIVGLKNAGAVNLLIGTLAYDHPSGTSGAAKRALRLSYTNALMNGLSSAGVTYKRDDLNAILNTMIANQTAYGFDYVDIGAGHTACSPTATTSGGGTVTISTAWGYLCSSDPAAPSQYVSADAPERMMWGDDSNYAAKAQRIVGLYMYKQVFGIKTRHDFNGDGRSDILWRSSAGDNAMWLMNGATALSVAGLPNVPTNWYVVGQRDFNGDGKTDLLWASTTGDVAIWLMNGSTITSVASLGNVGANWGVAGTGDFDGDGKGDILWRSTAGDNAIWFMNGTTLSSIAVVGNVPTNWAVAGMADFNGDGKRDILWRNSAGDNAIWLMNGATISSVAGLGNVPTDWSVVGTADFNGDGKGDIMWRNSGGDNAIWLMNGATISSVAGLGNVPTNWSVVSNGDYNGDGRSDILWRNLAGDNAIWFMNGTTLSSISGLGNVPTNWTIQNAAAN